jgi:uncharacterized protein
VRPPLEGCTALVTGASSGIGDALARELAPRVGRLLLVARRVERLEALAAELRGARPGLVVQVRGCDLADEAAVAALAAALEAEGGVDLLVNNAGLGVVELVERSAPARLDGMLRVNVLAPTWLTTALLPGMLQRGRGGVLNIGSGFGLTWMPAVAAYAGSKAYLHFFSEALRAELRGTGVFVTEVCPGPVRTEFEAVAGNPTGRAVPAFLEIDAARCAREAVAGYARGAARVVPGALMKVLLVLGACSPDWVLRLCYGWVGRARRGRPAVAR